MVCTDMNAGYMTMIKELFPNASIVIDRFHIIQALNNSLNSLRTRIMKMFKDNDNDRIYKQFKRYWKLLLMREDDVSSDDYGRKYHFKEWITSRKIVEHLINQDGELKEAYFTVQMLLDAYYSHNFSEFFNVIESSKNTISEELAVTFKTFIKNKKHIENSLRYNLSNGPIEGIINKIKNIKRTGYGYRNFFSLKARVLIIFNLGYSNTNRINKEIIDYSVNIA